MNEQATLLSYLSDPGWRIGRAPNDFSVRSRTDGEIRIEDGRLLLFDYLANDPEQAIVSCPVREVSVSPVRRWFGGGVALELGEEGKWYVKPPALRPKTGRRDTRRLIEAIAEAQRVA